MGKAEAPFEGTGRLSLLERLGGDRQAPGGLRVEALGEFAMGPLPVGEPRLKALRPFFP
jgi:hypothetical protein